VLQAVVKAASSKKLSEAQIAVLRAAWFDTTYHRVAEETCHDFTYLQNVVAPKLWANLSQIHGVKVGKKNLASVVKKTYFSGSFVAELVKNRQHKHEHLRVGKFPRSRYFLGRENELNTLQQEILSNRCVVVSGIEGIGKTALVAEISRSQRIVQEYEVILWKYCNFDDPDQDLKDLLQLICAEGFWANSVTDAVRSRRMLICIDGVEKWLQANRKAVDKVIENLSEIDHDSCFIVTTSEPLPIAEELNQDGRPISTLHLTGLSEQAACQLMEKHGLSSKCVSPLVQAYYGCPKLLISVSERIKVLFRGSVEAFLQYKTSFAEDTYHDYLERLFNLPESFLEDIDRVIINELAKETHYPTSDSIEEMLQKVYSYSLLQIRQSLDKLKKIPLIIQHSENNVSFVSLPAYVRKYIRMNLQQSPQA
jgi:hypothetical protein